MNLLGIDIGTTSLKAVLFDDTGKCLAQTSIDYTLTTQGESVEFDAMEYRAITRRAIDEIQKSHPIDAISVDTQGETLILTDGKGQPTMPAIVWLDNRAVEEADQIARQFGQKTIFEKTGQPETTGGWPACKLLWVQNKLPEVWKKTEKIYLLEDWILEDLTGEFVTEPTIQSSALYFDIEKRDWWDEMLDFIHVPRTMLPRIVPTASQVGQFGKIAVVSGALDQIAGAVGVGAVDENVVSEMTGTIMAICVVADRIPEYNPDSKIPCHLHALGDKYVNLLWSSTAGMALKWYRNEFAHEYSFQKLDEEAEKAGVGAEGLTMIPHLCGSTMPVYNPDARGAFWGLTLAHGKGHLARAILEAVAFTLKDDLDCIGADCDEIRITGGGASSPLWAQIKADVTGKRLATLTEKESACLGTAILAGVGIGLYPSIEEACRKIVRTKDTYLPSGTDYSVPYAQFKKLDELFHRMTRAAGDAQ